MTNPYYVASGTPSTGAFAASAPMRSEFDDVQAGFDLLPPLTAGTAVVVNGVGTELINTVGRFSLAGDFSTTGNFSVVLAASAAVMLTLPALSGTLATLAGTETLSNKTFVAPILGTIASGNGSNLTGTAAGFNVGHATTADSATTATTAGTASAVAVGGITGLGTGVGTALAINIGSNGAFVAFNGAGGTPSSMTATNLTGTAAGLTAGVASAVAVGGITGLGTGVATALAVSVGNAGAFVTFNGAGGTPSSMTATNLTGTAAGLTAGTASAVAVGGITGLGTNVAAALAISVGSAGAFVAFNGAGGTPSSMTATNLSGTAAGLTVGNATLAATVTTNANLTGPVTSAGNATSIASSIALPGSPTTTTQSASDNSTKIATTAYADRVAGLVGASWTPVDGSGAGLSFTSVSANYVQIGNMVHAYFSLTFPATGDMTNAVIGGLPITAANNNYANTASFLQNNSSAGSLYGVVIKNTKTFSLWNYLNQQNPNNTMSTLTISGCIIYPAT